ncbi:MAG: zinc-dependent metalloprotease [Sediminibacterium sp.]|nr:zinc-dependent metalloprotease [Sediminibacterium sp.]
MKTFFNVTGIFQIILFVFMMFAVKAQQVPVSVEPPLYSADYGLSKEIEMLHQQEQLTRGERNNLEEYTKQFINARKTAVLPDTSCVATIPVVFHVYHPQGSAAVTMNQIDYAIRDLNITFGGRDVDYTTVNSAFSGVKSYTKIRFARALVDPKGNPTTGVIYYKDREAGYGNGTGLDNEIATCAWDNYKYMNVYVMLDLYANNVSNNSGVAWYPSVTMSNINTARIVYNYQYLGFGGSSQNNTEFNQTFTHECGHYLNLKHTFDGNSCAGVGDNCNDTPPTNISAAGCNATVCSGLINGENYMDYNASCYKNFTMDQNLRMEAALQSPSRFSLWQYSNQVATGILNPASTNSCVTANKFFAYSKTKLNEDTVNNGSIEMPPVIIYACAGVTFSSPSATLIPGTDYSISNVPVGLSVSIVTSANGKWATLTFSGNAVNHLAGNSVNNIQLTFTNAAVLGGNVTAIQDYTQVFSIAFKNPWQKVCVTPNLTTTPSTTLNPFQTQGLIPRRYRLRYTSGAYYLDNYGRALITTAPTSDNLMFLPVGTVLDANSPWRAGGYPGVLYSNTHTVLNGQTGYVGFRMQAGNDYYYGWMKLSVNAPNAVTLLEYHYNEKPNEAIVVGSSCALGPTSFSDYAKDAIIFDVFPNPSTGNVTVLLPEEENAVIVYDVLGKEVLRYPQVSQRLNITFAHSGVYFITVNNGKQKSVRKVVVTQ